MPTKKPETETAPQPQGFDADARAKAREEAPHVIGGVTYHRRRKNWETTRTLRNLMRAQDRAQTKTARLVRELGELDGSAADELEVMLDALKAEDRDSDRAKRMRARLETLQADADKLDDEARDAQVDELHEAIDEATDAADDAAYRMIALLLRDDDGNAPEVEHLQAELDVEDAGGLVAKLTGGGEPDPTPPATPANATS